MNVVLQPVTTFILSFMYHKLFEAVKPRFFSEDLNRNCPSKRGVNYKQLKVSLKRFKVTKLRRSGRSWRRQVNPDVMQFNVSKRSESRYKAIHATVCTWQAYSLRRLLIRNRYLPVAYIRTRRRSRSPFLPYTSPFAFDPFRMGHLDLCHVYPSHWIRLMISSNNSN